MPVIMITAYHDMDTTVEAMQRGADDYIHKPIDIDELTDSVTHALARKFEDDNAESIGMELPSSSTTSTMVGHSHCMKEIYKTIGLVAKKPITVLITGESGTGKELVARAIHQASENPEAPFIAINCAALVESLLESELFGHVKGAFTGAISSKPGKFTLAENGVIFLDEIGELSLSMQAKLLRVLQEKEYVPVGGKEAKITNARVITATNVNLKERVEQDQFREDLYYRLQVVTIHMPALHERMEDLPDLVPSLLERINKKFHHKVTRLSLDVLHALQNYDWPGNVRELENTLLKAVAICPGDTLTLDLLPEAIQGEMTTAPHLDPASPNLSLADVEKAHVARVLEATHWHKGKTCEVLGISRPRLRRLITQYGLKSSSKETGEELA